MMKPIVLVGAVAVVALAAVVVPSFVRARNTSASNACVMHLLQIAGAKEQWVTENHRTTNDVVSWSNIKPYLSYKQVPQCPDGGTYILGRVGEAPRCSLAPAFVGGKSHELPK
jgi:cell division septation protein DedD